MRAPFKLALVAAALFALVEVFASMVMPAYSLRLPLAVNGASGVHGAVLFNLGAFILPGICLLLAQQAMYRVLALAGWVARMGMTLAQLSALAFALQGVFRLDLQELDGPAGRLHISMWTLWWISFLPAMLLLTASAKRGKGFAGLCLGAGLLVPLLALLVPTGIWVGLPQRFAFLLWFCWWLLAARTLTDTSTSAPGSSSPAGR
ncbi:MAG: DUF998 domain-containing protein [Thermomonas sp.]|uniref:DUF998 domain-containing protein n=1 Tax=Thermomonas sp. TaxID=1971895 RepID=UPI001DCCEA2A|nr:DUF998 domain-containing protein [Thermomonas sp.]MBZ0088030.1 DUF998 domain-containing protein [Thermomonas sp.]